MENNKGALKNMSDNRENAAEINTSRRKLLKDILPESVANANSSQNTPQKKVLGRKPHTVSRRTFLKLSAGAAAVVAVALALPALKPTTTDAPALKYKGKVLPADRVAAANSSITALNSGISVNAVPTQGGVPDYFGPYPNYAYSPMPTTTSVGPSSTLTLTGFTVSNGGSGYTTPVVQLSGGGGTGATAVAHVSNGVIRSITLTNPGTGYSSTPTITLSDPNPRATGAAISVTYSTNSSTLQVTGGIRKFVDTLPGLNAPNNLGQMIPIAVPDTITYPGSDYYEISAVQYTEQMHSDLPATTLRGFVQTNNGTNQGTQQNTVVPASVHYMGPVIIAQKDRPVRVKFTNELPLGTAGNYFIPVDTTYMGAGLGPDGTHIYTQNRVSVHLHGGTNPWISDGTPHQWITPAGETSTIYLKGDSSRNVPDMWFNPTTHAKVPAGTPGATNDPGPGKQTLYYTNQQTARLMFYHDHALGTTRIGVYTGLAAPYLVQDAVETTLVNGGTLNRPGQSSVSVPVGTIPATQIPLPKKIPSQVS